MLKYLLSILCENFVPALYENEATTVNSKIKGCFYIKFEILKDSLLLDEKYIFRYLNFSKNEIGY